MTSFALHNHTILPSSSSGTGAKVKSTIISPLKPSLNITLPWSLVSVRGNAFPVSARCMVELEQPFGYPVPHLHSRPAQPPYEDLTHSLSYSLSIHAFCFHAPPLFLPFLSHSRQEHRLEGRLRRVTLTRPVSSMVTRTLRRDKLGM